MQSIAKQIHMLLLKKGKTIAVAESCTGGILCGLLTDISGSSGYFILGTVVYSNSSKNLLLKIPLSVIRKNGAVSKAVALEMADSVRRLAKSDYGIGITGIAGPSGATLRKPVGTVFIALSAKNKAICQRFIFKGNRTNIRKQAAFKALQLLKNILTLR
jgi:nicotinamide-nucleotide amidase